MRFRNSISKHYLLEVYGSDGLYGYHNVEYGTNSTAMFEFNQILLFQYTTFRYNRVKEGRWISYLVMSEKNVGGLSSHLTRYAEKVSLDVLDDDIERFKQYVTASLSVTRTVTVVLLRWLIR